jgi:hypothetical protein
MLAEPILAVVKFVFHQKFHRLFCKSHPAAPPAILFSIRFILTVSAEFVKPGRLAANLKKIDKDSPLVFSPLPLYYYR